MVPVVQALKAQPGIRATLCVTAQHRKMLDQVLSIAGLTPDIDLDLMLPNQSLGDLLARMVTAVGMVLDRAFETLDQRVSQGGKQQEARRKIAALSKREREVMQGLLDGLPNKIIAFKLGISIRTVESFRALLMEKLGVRTVSAAVRLALLADLPALSEDAPPPPL